MHEDAALLRRYVAERSEDAFAQLVRRHVDGVYSAALRRVGGDTHLAEDVVQQVFVALARKAGVVQRHPVLTGWLYTTTRNEAANIVRGERRRKSREQEAQAMQEMSSEPASAAGWDRMRPVLDRVIDQLNERDRVAVLLRFVERRSFAEIGSILRLSEDAARMRVERALDRLRVLLTRRGIESTSAALAVVLTNHAVAAAPAGLAATVAGAAVTTVPAATAPLVSFLESMSTTKAIAAVAGMFVVIAVGTATRETHTLNEAEAALAAAVQSAGDMQAKLDAAVQRVAAAEQSAAELQAAIDEARAAQAAAEQRAKAAVAAPVTPTRSMQEAVAAGQAFLDRHPELKAAVAEYARSQVTTTFAAFCQSRNLTPEQAGEFARWMAMDSGVVRRITGVDGEQIVLAAPGFGDRERHAAMEQAITTMLGADGVAELRAYIREIPGRRLTGQLAGALYCSPTPLMPEQIDPLLRIAVESGATAPRWNGRYDWDVILDRAQGVLSGPQLAALGGFQLVEQYERALNQAMLGPTSRDR